MQNPFGIKQFLFGRDYPSKPRRLVWYLVSALKILTNFKCKQGITRPSWGESQQTLLVFAPKQDNAEEDSGARERNRLLERFALHNGAVETSVLWLGDDRSNSPQVIASSLGNRPFLRLILDDVFCLGSSILEVIVNAIRLRRHLRRLGVAPFVIVHDLLDPVAFLGAQILTQNIGVAIVLGNSTQEAAKLGMWTARGPKPQIVAPLTQETQEFRTKVGMRAFDLFLPDPGHAGREHVVRDVSDALASKFKLCGLQRIPEYTKYLATIGQSKAVLVVNDIRQSYCRIPRVAFDKSVVPSRHIVGRNFEALLCGSILLSQSCLALNDLLVPELHYLPWESSADVVHWMDWILANPGLADELAERGLAYATELCLDGFG